MYIPLVYRYHHNDKRQYDQAEKQIDAYGYLIRFHFTVIVSSGLISAISV